MNCYGIEIVSISPASKINPHEEMVVVCKGHYTKFRKMFNEAFDSIVTGRYSAFKYLQEKKIKGGYLFIGPWDCLRSYLCLDRLIGNEPVILSMIVEEQYANLIL